MGFPFQSSSASTPVDHPEQQLFGSKIIETTAHKVFTSLRFMAEFPQFGRQICALQILKCSI
jgi:hypothetical protein